MRTFVVAGGCFWCLDAVYRTLKGVSDVVSGYTGGSTAHPSYEAVCTGTTGHAETVKVVYDPARISYERLLEAFFKMHDPTQLDRQGPDVGTQYRSGVWYVNEAQKTAAEAYLAKLNERLAFKGTRAVTALEPAETFYPAEDYHQDYILTTGRTCNVANPW